MLSTVGNSLFQKQANSFLILSHLREHPCSRTELASALGLQSSTVTYSIGRLIGKGLVSEGKPSGSAQGKGRRRSLLEINPDYGFSAGALLLDHGFDLTVCDLSGKVRSTRRLDWEQGGQTGSAGAFRKKISQICRTVETLCAGKRILGVCIAVPGIIVADGKTVAECWTFDLKNADFSAFLDTFEFPVVLENDARLCAQRWLSSGSVCTARSLAYLLVRHHEASSIPAGISQLGIGLALALDGKLYRGDTGQSGEYRSSRLALKQETLKQQVDSTQPLRSQLVQVLCDVFSFLSVLDVSMLYLSFDGELESLAGEILAGELKYARETYRTRISFSHEEADASVGGALMVLEEVFSIPQVGGKQGYGHLLED